MSAPPLAANLLEPQKGDGKNMMEQQQFSWQEWQGYPLLVISTSATKKPLPSGPRKRL
jgi:hypothetical protein